MTPSLHTVERGEGKPVLWIHGFPLSSAIYEPQLAIRGYRHIVPDLPGFGRSPTTHPSATIPAYADEMFRVLDERQVERAVFAGLSMGGYIALAAARKNAGRVAALILIDTREIADTAEGREKRLATVRAVQRDGIRVVHDDMLPKLLSPEADEATRGRVSAIVQSSTPQGVVGALEAMANRSDSADLLPKLTMPVLVVVGSGDVITPPSDAQRMAKALPNARLATIQGAGHLSNFERPDEFNKAATAFLSEYY